MFIIKILYLKAPVSRNFGIPHYPATVILPYGAGRAGKFRADILVEKRVIVENKVMKKITKQDEAQLIT